MANETLIAILSFAGTLIGSAAGILTANRLANYRIEQLENQVKKHNNLVERMFSLEARANVIEERQDDANRRIDDLEKGQDKINDRMTRRNSL